MDLFLSKVTQQAMNYAIRSGVAITASYALRQSTRLLKTVKSSQREELVKLQERLQQKIKIISPAIDMIELISARGNTSLESAISLTKEIRWEIQSLGQRLAKAASHEELAKRSSSRAKTQAETEAELKLIAQDIQKLLDRIEDAVPLINLAITTSGASLSTSLPATVSPSRLLQASTFLTAADTQYCMTPGHSIPVGPNFTLSVYMLFEAHVRDEGIRETTWKEVIHKARVKLRRAPMDTLRGNSHNLRRKSSTAPDSTGASARGPHDYIDAHMDAEARVDEFAYQLVIVEDFDDDRMHDFEDNEVKPGRFEDVMLAGIREIIPVHEISKIFYADTGKILNIGGDGETNSPVLLLKRDLNAIPPRHMVEREADEYDVEEDLGDTDSSALGIHPPQLAQSLQNAPDSQEQSLRDPWSLPPGLDAEWIAFEVYVETEDSEDELDAERPTLPTRKSFQSPSIAQAFSGMHINNTLKSNSASLTSSPPPMLHGSVHDTTSPSLSVPMSYSNSQPSPFNNIRTSLSLLEMLLRLTSLQQFQQQSHLSINDELLNFFLEESAATGAGGDESHRQRLRADARRRVGWDPYDESPLKRRGEEYQYNGQEVESGDWPYDENGWDENRNDYDNPRFSPRGSISTGYRLRSREQTPESPPDFHRNQSPRVSGTVNSQYRPSSSTLPSTPSGPPKGRQALLRRQMEGAGGRKGSPLARPNTGVTDEGLGTSPGSQSDPGIENLAGKNMNIGGEGNVKG